MEIITVSVLSNPTDFKIDGAKINLWDGHLYQLIAGKEYPSRGNVDLWRETEKGAKIAFTKIYGTGGKWSKPNGSG